MDSPREHPRTIGELCDRAERWADEYYRREGVPTREATNIRGALMPLRELAGYESLAALTADLLYDCRQWMIDRGLSRQTINGRLKRIKTILRWSARPPRRWLTAQAIADVDLAEPLKKWRTDAPEGPGVHPVDWPLVERTIMAAPPWLSVALRIHWHTGMRPSEVVAMKRSEIADRGDVMVYSPRLHKCAHLDRLRHVVIGPQGQTALRPWMACVMQDKLFHIHSEQALYQAIRRVNKASGIPSWSPNQIRHSYLTRIGLMDPDGARAVAGHTTIRTTEIYIERDLTRAIEIQRVHG